MKVVNKAGNRIKNKAKDSFYETEDKPELSQGGTYMGKDFKAAIPKT